MKNYLSVLAIFSITFCGNSQIKTPALSPAAKITQTIGLTDFEIEYARPSKRDRVVFGDVVPFNEIWRTGANKNTTFMTSEAIVIGKDTLKAGTYALYTKPMAASWDIIFYSSTDNWGTPDEWDESKVVLKANVPMQNLKDKVETFTISFDELTTSSGQLCMAWENTKVALKFKLLTGQKVEQMITKTMAGPAYSDYYSAARYYYEEKKNLPEALTYINKSIEMQKDAPFYYYRMKALIQAENGDKKGAIESARISMEKATKAGNTDYVKMNEKSIQEWSK